jgi:hypothetical protein
VALQVLYFPSTGEPAMKDRHAGSSLWPILVLTVVVILWDSDAMASSKTEAAEGVRRSHRIALTLVGFSALVIAAGSVPLALQGKFATLLSFWVSSPLHPGLWVILTNADYVDVLRSRSLLMMVLYALAMVLAITWPGSQYSKAKKWRGTTGGGLAGAIAGTLLIYFQLTTGGRPPVDTMLVACWAFASIVVVGAMCGTRLCDVQGRPWHRLRSRARTLVILPAIIAPVLVVLLPVRHHHSLAITSPVRFVVIDAETGEPISNATVSLVDPLDPSPPQIPHGRQTFGYRFTCGLERQMFVGTGPDGRGDLYLRASVTVRKGLLGRTEAVAFDPCTIRVEAAGYELVLEPLRSDALSRSSGWFAGSLDSASPPPPSTFVGLRRKTAGVSSERR